MMTRPTGKKYTNMYVMSLYQSTNQIECSQLKSMPNFNLTVPIAWLINKLYNKR